MSSDPRAAIVAVTVGDAISLAAVLGSWVGLLPGIATLAALLWYGLEIWESDTVQGWVKGPARMKREKRARRIARAMKDLEHERAEELKDEQDLAEHDRIS